MIGDERVLLLAQRAGKHSQEPIFALWGRDGVTDEVIHQGALGFAASGMVGVKLRRG